jgi:hypothetical protein
MAAHKNHSKNHINFKFDNNTINMEDEYPRTRKTIGYFETYTFKVPRSAKRVHRNFKCSDEWMPLLYTMAFDGNRIRDSGSQGTVGVAYKAEYYQATSSFLKEKYERFEITAYQYDAERHVGEIVVEHKPNLLRNRNRATEITLEWIQTEDGPHSEISVTTLKLPTRGLNFGFFKVKPRELQNREDCIEELQLYLSH